MKSVNIYIYIATSLHFDTYSFIQKTFTNFFLKKRMS